MANELEPGKNLIRKRISLDTHSTFIDWVLVSAPHVAVLYGGF